MKRFFLSAGLVTMLVLLFLDYQNNSNPGECYFNQLATPATTNDIASYDFTPEHLTLRLNAMGDAYFSFAFPVKFSFPKRIQIDFSKLHGISSISVFYRLEGDRGFGHEMQHRVSDMRHRINDKNEYSYSFLLPRGAYTSLRFDFGGNMPDATVVIKDLRLLDLSVFFYTQSYFHLLTVLILTLLILPGVLLSTLYTDHTKSDSESNLILFFGLSLVFYLLLYGVLDISHRLGINPHLSVPSAFALLLAILVGMIFITKRIDILRRMVLAEKKAFLSVFALSIICGILVTGFVRTPFSFDTINWDTVDGEVIFSRFTGHDNMFQYVNGIAIADNEPFSKYYADGKLMFDVQDREILGGVIYSVFRTLISSISPYMGESYLTYTLFGLCMNVMVVFPLIVLFRRYFLDRSVYLFVLLLSLNTFVLANYFYTWFKFSGAALFISGILILFRNRKSPLSWLFAGVLFGLSTNMHAGNALGIPLIFLLIVYFNIHEEGVLHKTVLTYPLVLCFAFLLVNVPWAVVKMLHFQDHHALFYFHYLPGSDVQEGLLKNISNFLITHPLQEQFTYRLVNLYNSLRFSEFSYFFSEIPGNSTDRLLYIWNDIEFSFFSLAIAPVLCIATICSVVAFIQSKMIVGRDKFLFVDPQQHQEYQALLVVSFCSIASLLLLSYNDTPDATWHLPMGLILIIQTLLIGFSLNSGLLGKGLLLAYGCLTFWRIGSMFLYFL